MATKSEFSKGYMCALACLVRSHGLDREVEDALSCNFMNVRQMRAAGIDENDIEALTPAINELERKKKVFFSQPLFKP